MKDKEKQIEEMAYVCCSLEYKPTSCLDCIGKMMCDEYANAEKYVEQGYRKLPEDSVVLSREEYNIIDHNIKHLESVCKAHEKTIAYWEDQTKVAREEIDNAVKETAEKILTEIKEKLKSCPSVFEWNVLKNGYDNGYYRPYVVGVLDEIAKQNGVEIGGEK